MKAVDAQRDHRERALAALHAMSCTGKTPYPTKVDAERVKRHRENGKGRMKRSGGRGDMEAYRCMFCKSWHLGSSSAPRRGFR